jgi:NAD+ diphosphatase
VPGADALAFAFAGGRLAVAISDDQAVVPTFAELADGAGTRAAIYLGRLDGRPCFAVLLEESHEPSAPLELAGLRELFGRLDDQLHTVAGRAFQTLEWFRNHAFCGRCGAPTLEVPGERARACPRCGTQYYPRINPAVIMLVELDDRILLARNRQFRGPFYSCLAGFVEPGESLEEAVEREVWEEVGIAISDVNYFASQPWPFPSQLMIGFTARYRSGRLRLQDAELLDAGWFAADQLPELPGRFSLARRLIESFLSRRPGKGQGLLQDR